MTTEGHPRKLDADDDHTYEDIGHHHHFTGPRHFFQVAPVLLVDDVKAAAEYYRDVLGFSIDFLHGEPAEYSSVSRNEVSINLSLSVPPGRRNGMPALGGSGNGNDMYVVVSDIDDLCEELKGRGAVIAWGPSTWPYGMREFKIIDPNGYHIVFGEGVEAPN